MAAPAKKKVRRRTKQTLAEFKAWLEGVEELQPENWAPNHDQWELIRGRINGIIEPVPEIIKEEVTQQPVNPLASRPTQPLQQQVNPAFAAPPVPSSIPNNPVVKHDGSGYTPEPAVAAPQMPTTEGGRSKTPNIDTTDGSYESSFG